MQAVSGDVSWQAQIGAVQSWTQSSSSGHTFLSYLCSKLDLLLLLISCQEFSIWGPLSLSLLHYLFCSLVLTPLLFFSLFLSLPRSGRADAEQKRLMVIKIRKQGDVRPLLGQAGTKTVLVPTASPQREALCPREAPLTCGAHTKQTDPFNKEDYIVTRVFLPISLDLCSSSLVDFFLTNSQIFFEILKIKLWLVYIHSILIVLNSCLFHHSYSICGLVAFNENNNI